MTTTRTEPGPQRPAVSPAAVAETPAPPQSTEVVETPKPDPARIIAELNTRLQDAFFDYDQFDLRPDALAALHEDATLLASALADVPGFHVVIEGHCDERGSAEYNLALGDQRAQRAAEYLYNLGVPRERAEVMSYGREAPQCTEQTESCWQRNRRAHIKLRP